MIFLFVNDGATSLGWWFTCKKQ